MNAKIKNKLYFKVSFSKYANMFVLLVSVVRSAVSDKSKYSTGGQRHKNKKMFHNSRGIARMAVPGLDTVSL